MEIEIHDSEQSDLGEVEKKIEEAKESVNVIADGLYQEVLYGYDDGSFSVFQDTYMVLYLLDKELKRLKNLEWRELKDEFDKAKNDSND